jgi:hypothetical protein
MGCDIHAFAERKSGEKWKQIRGEFRHEDYEKKPHWTDEVYDGRDYELFAFLADVRNDNEIKPLAQPRGVPVDASLGYQAEVEHYGADGHSHSYFTLAELRSIPSELLEQEIDDKHVVLSKDASGKITGTAGWTSGKHMGVVGRRKLFRLWDETGPTPLERIIEQLDKVGYQSSDDKIRMVFFFDN